MVRFIRKFKRDERGISMTEGLLTLPIILFMMAALVEFGFVVYQWNQTAKAMQLGARLLAVSDPIVSDAAFATLGTYDSSLVAGDPTPADGLSVSCTGAGCNAGIDRVITGSDGVCAANYGTVSGMCDLNPRIRKENVRVTYTRAGLGYVGRPGLPVVTVTVEAVGLTFDLPLIGALIQEIVGESFDGIAVPANPVTVTSEDLDSNG